MFLEVCRFGRNMAQWPFLRPMRTLSPPSVGGLPRSLGNSCYRNNGPSGPPFAVFSLDDKVAVAANHQVIANSAGRTRQSRHRTQTRPAQPTRAGYPAASLKLAAAASGVRSRWGEPSISKPTMNFRIVAERRSGG
jgi:hypothetical protein